MALADIPKTPGGQFIKRALDGFPGLISAFRGQGDGKGHPRDRSSILALLNGQISLKKLNFIFKMS